MESFLSDISEKSSSSILKKNFDPDSRAEISSHIKDVAEPKEERNSEDKDSYDPDTRAEVSKKGERTPVEGNGGHWDGERGNSNWIPDDDEVPSNPKTNPDEKSWGEIKDEYEIETIPFQDNNPDFSEVSKGTVEIDDFTDDRDSNFSQADEKLAEERGCEPEDVCAWRKENHYTWHEQSDCKTMQKVPTEVHGNVPHSGGVSEYKNRNQGE